MLKTAIAGIPVIADPAGLLAVPGGGILVASDLHFEKGSAWAAGGQLMPPYDTRATLKRLAAGIARHAPSTVIALGDSFHDLRAGGVGVTLDLDRGQSRPRPAAAIRW